MSAWFCLRVPSQPGKVHLQLPDPVCLRYRLWYITVLPFHDGMLPLERQAVNESQHSATLIKAIDGADCVVCFWAPNRSFAASLPDTGMSFCQISGLLEGELPEQVVHLCAGSISGDNFDISIIPQNLLRPVQSTAPSGPWLYPSPDQWGDKVCIQRPRHLSQGFAGIWIICTAGIYTCVLSRQGFPGRRLMRNLISLGAEQVLVETQKKNYTAKDALQLLKDLNLTQQVSILPALQFFMSTDLSPMPPKQLLSVPKQ